MSSFQPLTASKPDETRWIIHIKESFIQELEEDTVTPATIFNVPKVLMASDPLSYTPQQVAIGPYHYWRPELYEMEKYKLDAAKRYSKLLPEGLKFQELVDKLAKKRVPRIRSSYDKYLSINDETLAWMVIMDACFLLEFLCVYAVKEGVIEPDRLPGRTSHMVDVSGRKSAHNVMLRDIVMLENQIPLFVLRKLLKWEFSSKDLGDERLRTMLSGLCKDLSPFVNIGEEDMAKVPLDGCAHLLDFLYKVMVPDMDEPFKETRDFEGQSSGNIIYEDDDDGSEEQAKSLGDSSNLKRLVQEIWKILSKIKSVPTDVLNVIVNLPWDVLGNLPGVKNLKQRLFPATQGSKKSDDVDGSERSPLLEEISIPSVYKLTKSGVQFSPTDSGILSIAFDSNARMLYLPVINLDVNSQVVLRNMVAYESCIARGPLVFTRYTELMNGVIDSENDTNVLTEKGILLNHLKNDEEAANLWNGMSKSIRLTKVPLIDKTIGDVNKYYNGKWKVKAGKFMKSYIYASWKILTVLATILLLVLLTLQSFCSVYSCPRLFNINTTS